MPKRTPGQSARLSSLAKRFGPDRAAALRYGVQVGRCPESEAQAYLNAWNSGKIRWQDIPAEYREVVS